MITDARLAYTVTLTAEEFRTLQWLEDHGYSGNMIKYATACTDLPDGGVQLDYRESDAWQVRDYAHYWQCRDCHKLLYADSTAVDGLGDPCNETTPDHVLGEEELDESFAACATPTLRRKMFAFLNAIV